MCRAARFSSENSNNVYSDYLAGVASDQAIAERMEHEAWLEKERLEYEARWEEEHKWEIETAAWLADPKNFDSEIYSDVFKDLYGVRPRWRCVA